MADEGSGTTVEEPGTAASDALRVEADPDDVTTSTARVKPTETRLSLARIPVFTKFVHPRFRKPKADGEDAAKAAERCTTEGTSTYRASTNPKSKTDHPDIHNLHADIFPLIARNAAPREAAKLCRLSRLHAQLITKKDLSWAVAGMLWRDAQLITKKDLSRAAAGMSWREKLKKSRLRKAIKTLGARTVGVDIPTLPKLYKSLYERFPAVPVDCAARVLKGLFVLGASINVEGSEAVLEDTIERGHEPVVRTLVKGGINIHANNDQALCEASKLGRYDICDILIKSGANVNAHWGLPLLYAAEFGYTAMCKLLIEAGAGFKHYENDYRLLRTAADKGQLDVVRTLLLLGGDVFTNQDFFRALAVAHCCGRKGVGHIMIEGSTPDREVSLEQEGALLRAARKQDNCIVHTILVNGAGRLSWVLPEHPRTRPYTILNDPLHPVLPDSFRNREHAEQLPFYEDQDDGEGTGHEN
ncbi:hypothetical protein HK104_009679 [Borealophlyctis nickersoniae]|nr:hypothetical protein HK104_009679 [Borealophlyctis nickersoniae]